MGRVPILAYHNVDRAPPKVALPRLYVTPQKFAQQMWLLQRLGWRGVSMSEGMAALYDANPSRRADRLVVLTFDDGYADNLEHAAPILQRHGFTATCYLVSDHLGAHNEWDSDHLGVRKRLMNDEQVAAWLAAGMEIGSHTCSHPRMDHIDDATALDQLERSRRTLGERFGVDIRHFCYPFGRYRPGTVELVRRAGYASAVTTGRGIACANDDPYELPRASVHGDAGHLKFFLKVATGYENRRRKPS